METSIDSERNHPHRVVERDPVTAITDLCDAMGLRRILLDRL